MGYREIILADNPTSYWRLNESSGTTATDQKGVNNGTITGGVTLGVTGATTGDTAMSFNGTSGYVALSQLSGLQTPNFSLEAWFKTTNNASQKIYRWRLNGNMLIINGGLPQVIYNDSAANVHSAASSVNHADGNWHHMVGTYDGSTLKLYLDGSLTVSTSTSAPIFYGGGGVAIGRDGDFSGEYFNGSIDEVAVYNYALTASKVNSHFVAATSTFAVGSDSGSGTENIRSTGALVPQVIETDQALAVSPVPPGTLITRTQSISAYFRDANYPTVDQGPEISATFPSEVSAGSLLVVAISLNVGADDLTFVTDVSDDLNGAWSLLSEYEDRDEEQYSGLYYFYPSQAGVTTVTVTFHSSTYGGIVIAEYSDVGVLVNGAGQIEVNMSHYAVFNPDVTPCIDDLPTTTCPTLLLSGIGSYAQGDPTAFEYTAGTGWDLIDSWDEPGDANGALEDQGVGTAGLDPGDYQAEWVHNRDTRIVQVVASGALGPAGARFMEVSDSGQGLSTETKQFSVGDVGHGTEVYPQIREPTNPGQPAQPGVPVVKWRFYDPLMDESTYFLINPRDDASVERQRTITFQALPKNAGWDSYVSRSVMFEGLSAVPHLRWSGTILNESEYAMYVYWFRKRHEIIVSDDFHRNWTIIIKSFKPKRVVSGTVFWRHTYDVDAIIMSSEDV